MTKRAESKYKLDRRMGQNIWGRPKSPVNRREYGPGQHGQRRKGKMSDFGTQLKAKQKLKGYYAPTPFAARQFVNHGHVKVNGRKVNIASYLVKPGDVIEVKDTSRQLLIVLESVQLPERDVPEYYEVDHSKLTAKMSRIPLPAEVPYPVHMEPNLVIEFYSR